MKKLLLISLLIGAMPLGMAAQDDDLYFVSKKKNVENVTDDYAMPRGTYYSGSNRSVDEYNRRSSYYEQIDSTVSDVIDFSAERGVYPDSIAEDDFKLTKKMSRFDDYDISLNEAFWAGYNAGRNDWGWYSPWYFDRYGWYDPWYYGPYVWDPWYYGYTGWYGPSLSRWAWRYHYWGYPYYNTVYYVGSGRHYGNNHTGTIRHGNMNGRVYGGSSYRRGGRVASSRVGSLTNRSVGGHRAYGSSSAASRSVGSHSSYNRSRGSSVSHNSSFSRSSSYGGGSFGGGGVSRGGGFSGGGGGGRSGGGHVGGRR